MSQWTSADIIRITGRPGYRVVGAPPRADRAGFAALPVGLVLPFPPSVNHYLRRGAGGTIRHTEATLAYLAEVDRIISLLDDPRFPLCGDLTVRIDAYPADRRRRDLDNLLKVPLDALQQAGVYKDDYQICELHLSRLAPQTPAHLVVTITAKEAP